MYVSNFACIKLVGICKKLYSEDCWKMSKALLVFLCTPWHCYFRFRAVLLRGSKAKFMFQFRAILRSQTARTDIGSNQRFSISMTLNQHEVETFPLLSNLSSRVIFGRCWTYTGKAHEFLHSAKQRVCKNYEVTLFRQKQNVQKCMSSRCRKAASLC